jgi:transposase
MPRRTRRNYPPEFKARAVELVLKSGKSVTQMSKDLGVTQTVLNDWVNKATRGISKDELPQLEETPEAELKRLREEVYVLRMERDFLKKAAAFFAKDSK